VSENEISLLSFEIEELKLDEDDKEEEEENVCNYSRVIIKITLRVDKKIV
jgi:hypothetical protein